MAPCPEQDPQEPTSPCFLLMFPRGFCAPSPQGPTPLGLGASCSQGTPGELGAGGSEVPRAISLFSLPLPPPQTAIFTTSDSVSQVAGSSCWMVAVYVQGQ